ncbi:hypothetical protein PHISP_00997 [Aspergillus sp. HF37]|nr:hypothetical protein PHISP_00997 [Aspergillus sp. HF37]
MLQFTALPAPLNISQPSTTPRTVTGDQSCPCRHCLQDGQLGEEMLLVSYNPFLGVSPYAGSGPVFVHRDTCKQYRCDGTVPEQQRRRLLAVRSYDKDHMMKDFAIVGGTELEEKAEELLGKADADYALVYYAGPGCFAARVDRK